MYSIRFRKLTRFLPLLLMLFSAFLLQAQTGQNEDVVYLKNGSEIRGTILEMDTEGDIKIELLGGSVLVYPMSEVQRITREPKKVQLPQKREATLKEKGFFNNTDIGFNIGSNYGSYYGGGTSLGFTLQDVMGYRFNKWIGVGAGIGIDLYNSYQIPISPVYLRVEGQILSEPITPIYYAEAGYGLMWNRQVNEYITQKNGPMMSAGVGIRFATPGAVALQVTAGYKSQKLTTITKYDWNQTENIMEEIYKRVSLRFGMSF